MLSILLLISGIMKLNYRQENSFEVRYEWNQKSVLRDRPRYFHTAGLFSLQAYKLFIPVSFPVEELFCWRNEL